MIKILTCCSFHTKNIKTLKLYSYSTEIKPEHPSVTGSCQVKKAERPFSKDLDTHHHYGAQQVGTLKVDPISETTVLYLCGEPVSLRFKRLSPFVKPRPGFGGSSFNKRSFSFLLFFLFFFFLLPLARRGEINPRFRLVRRRRLGVKVLKAATVARWPECTLLENIQSEGEQPVIF